LNNATLRRTVGERANIQHVEAVHADFTDALLLDLDARAADFYTANFTGSIIRFTQFEQASFTGSLGLARATIIPAKELAETMRKADQPRVARQVEGSRRRQLLDGAPLSEQALETLFLGGWVTRYGGEPENAWVLIITTIPFFFGMYTSGIRKGQLFLQWPSRPTGAIRGKTITRDLATLPLPEGQKYLLLLQFSIENALLAKVGPLDLANLVGGLRRRTCTVIAAGRTSTIAGVHSVLTFYLLSVWLYRYFQDGK
jgi:hypothetical protein